MVKERFLPGVPEVAVESLFKALHRDDVRDFAARVAEDEVLLMACSYRASLAGWNASEGLGIHAHAAEVSARYAP